MGTVATLPGPHPGSLFPNTATQQGSLGHSSKATLPEPGLTQKSGYTHLPRDLPPHKAVCKHLGTCSTVSIEGTGSNPSSQYSDGAHTVS